jgi:Mannosyl-glycoprotein endo-beta-N-acetylglucosaminidase
MPPCWQRARLPLVVLCLTVMGAACVGNLAPETSGANVRGEVAAQRFGPHTSVIPHVPDDAGLMLPGRSAAKADTAEVLPTDGAAEAVAAPPSQSSAPSIRWVKNGARTTLWSSAHPDAAAFTELPAGSYLRVEGPEDGGRLPVYYVGDGVLRRAGGAWVDSAAVEAVEAPPPGQVSAVDADAKQPMPLWVQAHESTRLWSGPDDKAVPLTDLPQWTFLKVSGLERDGRILVNFAGDFATRQPGIGWVEQGAIGPAGDPGVWVTNHRATALWSGVDDKATRFNDLPQWTKLRLVEGAPPDDARIEIQYFGDGASRLPGMAWIARDAIGPITPPVPLPSVPPVGAGRTPERHAFGSGAEFIDTVGRAAQRSMKTTGVPASVTVAQAILESDWGRSRLTRQGNNLFGIKALGAGGPAGVVSMATWEHVDGSDVVVQAPFKAYYTLQESIDDHGRFFTRNRRYAAALAVADDARAFAAAIQDAGYATDPGYASKLTRLMDRYDLYRFDD